MNNPVRVRYWIYDLIKKYYKIETNNPQLKNLPQINSMNLELINIFDESTSEYIGVLISSLKVKAENV
jgi:hypothetical protein